MSEKKYQKLDTGPIEADAGAEIAVEVRSSQRRSLVVISLCLITITLITSLYYLRLVCGTTQPLTYTSGDGGRTQTVLASVDENFVEYYIDDVVNSERTWILDDFTANVEILKTVVDDYGICYVVELNHTEAIRPSSVEKLRAGLVNKRQFHTILTPDPEHLRDKSVLGARGSNLCQDVNVYWLRPMNDVIDITETGASLNTTGTDMLVSGSGVRRSKRNIRECHSSCCWLVCCCDVHHFKWESIESFTCKHVCEKCTPAYKSKIQKIC